MHDIDIDFASRDHILHLIPHIPASRIVNGNLVKHNSGVYLQSIPIDYETGLASIPYENADDRGWLKIDFLNLSIYEQIKNEDHLNSLLAKDIPWNVFHDRAFVDKVLHVKGHYDTVIKYHYPTSIEQLSMILAMRLPSKRHLVGKSWDVIEKEIWEHTNEYYFKKAHAVAYAFAVVVHIQLLLSSSLGDGE